VGSPPIDAETVLVAHGDPWTGGLQRALEIVRAQNGVIE
jgi:hypothetical protein